MLVLSLLVLLLHSALLRGVEANDLVKAVEGEHMNIWVVSHGGVAMKALATYLERFRFRVKTTIWQESLAYSPQPLPLPPPLQLKAAIYVYGHPFISACSMKTRGTAEQVYSQLKSPLNQTYSDGNLIHAMYNQYLSWTQADSNAFEYPIYVLNYYDLFEPKCLDMLFQHRTKKRFPFRRISRRTFNLALCEGQLELSYQHYDMLQRMLDFESDCHTTMRSRLVEMEAEKLSNPLTFQSKHAKHEGLRERAYIFMVGFVIFVLFVNVIAHYARKYAVLPKAGLRYADYKFEKYKKKFQLNKIG